MYVCSEPTYESLYCVFHYIVLYHGGNGIAQLYSVGLRAVWSEFGVLAHDRVRNGSGAHQASYPIGTKASFLEGKAAGA